MMKVFLWHSLMSTPVFSWNTFLRIWVAVSLPRAVRKIICLEQSMLFLLWLVRAGEEMYPFLSLFGFLNFYIYVLIHSTLYTLHVVALLH